MTRGRKKERKKERHHQMEIEQLEFEEGKRRISVEEKIILEKLRIGRDSGMHLNQPSIATNNSTTLTNSII